MSEYIECRNYESCKSTHSAPLKPRIVIYGYGKFGKWIIKQLKHFQDIEIVGIIDNYKIESDHQDIEYEIWKPEEMLAEVNIKKIDYVIITVLDQEHLISELFMKFNQTKFKVLFLPNYYYFYKISITNGLNFLINDCSEVQIENRLPYVEMHVEDDCNLNCRGCSHFSPLFPRNSIVPYSFFEQDIFQLKKIFKNIMKLRLLGGEPFLNKEIGRYLETARNCFPYSDIRVCSNGLLFPSLNNDILKSIRENYITIDISPYKPSLKLKRKILEIAKKEKISVQFLSDSPVEEFNVSFASSINKKWNYQCTANGGCTNVYNGRYSKCPMAMYVFKFNEVFQKNYPEDGVYDLYEEGLTADRFKKLLLQRIHLCDYCIKYTMEWDTYKNDECMVSDWVVDERKENIND